MSLEAERIANAAEPLPGERRARSERRGRDRRRSDNRINKAAPRRSLMRLCGAWATGLSVGVFIVLFFSAAILLETTPWTALFVAGAAVITSVFALMLGSIEERLIEIRLELMMGNGGMRQGDRRTADRRT